MSNKNKLTDAEKYCIEKMAKEGHSKSEVAKFIERSLPTVSRHWPELPEEPEKPKGKTFFLNKTGTGKGGVNIMTGAEAARSEHIRSNPKVLDRFKKSTHQIHDDEE